MFNGNGSTEQQELNIVDMLGIMGTILGFLNYQENLKQTTNNDLRDEFERDIHELVLKVETMQTEIIENQKEILRLLKRSELDES